MLWPVMCVQDGRLLAWLVHGRQCLLLHRMLKEYAHATPAKLVLFCGSDAFGNDSCCFCRGQDYLGPQMAPLWAATAS